MLFPGKENQTQYNGNQSSGVAWGVRFADAHYGTKTQNGIPAKVIFEKTQIAFSGKRSELTLENGALFTKHRKPHKIIQIKRFKSSCSL